MKTERPEDLIVALAADAAVVRPLPPVRTRLLRWLAGSAAVSGAGILAIGARPDLSAAIQRPSFAGDAALTLATGVLAAGAAFALSVPGGERTPLQRRLPIVLLGAWAGVLLGRLVAAGAPWQALASEPWHAGCAVRMLLISAAPAIAALVMIRRAAPLEPAWTAALASLAALSIATVAVQIVCPIDATAHAIGSHLAPLVALAAVGTLAGSRAFSDRT